MDKESVLGWIFLFFGWLLMSLNNPSFALLLFSVAFGLFLSSIIKQISKR